MRTGRPADEAKYIYQTLLQEIRARGLYVTKLAREADITYQSFYKKMTGQREWKLRECIELRRLIGSPLDLEDLFREG